MIVVCYHLIRPPTAPWLSGLPSITPGQLEQQLLHLMAHHQIITPQELHSSIENGKLPSNSCVLSFDDGSVGQYEHAFPILKKHGLRGFFFVPTCILEEKRVPTVEKQRVVQYCMWPYEVFYETFCNAIENHCPDLNPCLYRPTDHNLASALNYWSEYEFYTPLERLYRKVRDTVLPREAFDNIISLIFSSGFDEQSFVDRFCVDWDKVLEMESDNQEIGAHGHLHLIDTRVSAATATRDAAICIDILNTQLQRKVRSYAYPYGISTPDTVQAIQQKGIVLGFTCDAGIACGESPLALPRLDTKMFPFDSGAMLCKWSELELSRE